MLFPKKKKKVVHHETKRKESVYEKTTARIGEGIGKLGIGKAQESKDHFFETVRLFFTEFMPIHYQFTFEELKKEVDGKRLSPELKDRIGKFIEELTDSEYHPEGIQEEKIEKFYIHFGQLVEMLKSELIVMQPHDNSPHLSFNFGPMIKESDSEQKIKVLLAEGHTYVVSKDVERGRETYEEINKHFNSLDEKKKAEIYPKIMEFYKKLLAIHN